MAVVAKDPLQGRRMHRKKEGKKENWEDEWIND